MFNYATNQKCWQMTPEPDRNAVQTVTDALHILPATARLLCGRGFTTPESAKAFLGKETEYLHDPYLLKDMDKAVARIRQALVNQEKIVVYGDYDVDGVTAVTILYSYLLIHSADATYYIPNRIGEGYGINPDAVKSFAHDGATLIITVDTGITANAEIAEAKKLGVDTVVTDHHACRDTLPDCAAVVNPRRPDCTYPFKELAGVGVAFKLICALEQNLRSTSLYNAVKFATNRCGELVAIGTIADVMPLTDENRIIVSYGLSLLEHTSNIGIQALLAASGVTAVTDDNIEYKKKITSSLVGYTLAPRINAAGRIADATMAVELFLCEERVRAYEIACGLCDINRRRQNEENVITAEASEKIDAQCNPNDYVIVLDDDHWHHGVIGIVSSRLTEKYNLPSILISFEGQSSNPPSGNDVGKGSGRSVKGMNLVDALEACQSHLVKFGGHELAAGLSVTRDELSVFRKAINEYAKTVFDKNPPVSVISVDMPLQPNEISLTLAEELYLLEPYGVSNVQPIFESDRMTITDIVPLSQGKHTKLTLRSCGLTFTALCFGVPTDEFQYHVGNVVDVCYHLDVNEFHDAKTVQLLVKDLRLAGTVVSYYPLRDDFAKLWRYLKAQRKSGGESTTLSALSASLKLPTDTISAMLDIFAELSLIRLFRDGARIVAVPLPVNTKMNLETSAIYTALSVKKGNG